MHAHDLVVIGAGPGGYVAAIRAAQLGLNVAVVEKETALGGTCLRIGCIPSKALLESSERFLEARDHLADHGIKTGKLKLDLPAMLKRKDDIVSDLTRGVDGLFKKNKITRYTGHARLDGPGHVVVESPAASGSKSDGEFTKLSAGDILIATGSQPAPLKGVQLDGDRIGTSTDALSYEQVPEHLVVIGAGYIGLELGSVWSRLGAKVTVLEYLDRILPGMDSEIAQDALKLFKRQGLEFRLGTRVTAARADGKSCIVEAADSEPIHCDRVLLAVGRVPNTENLGLDTVGVQLNERGFVRIDENFKTTADNVYAIGDVVGGAMLAHKAEDEGVACAEIIAGGHGHVNYNAIPGVVYTNPEIASVGKSEDELKQSGVDYRRGVFFFRGNGRARALNQVDGKVKVLADAKTDRVLGVHIIGPRAGDLIAEAAVAIEFHASAEDLGRTSHAHPTLAECLKEAALAADGRALHA